MSYAWSEQAYEEKRVYAHQFEYSNLHHALIEISRLVFDNFDSNDLVGLHILAFHNLPERSLSENIQDEVSTMNG